MAADAYLFQLWHRDQLMAPQTEVNIGARPAGASQIVQLPGKIGEASLRDSLAPVSVGTPIAQLEIPRLDLSVVVAEGTTSRVLRRAVGRVTTSARLGESGGNVVFAGHRDTFFRPLEDVQIGDVLYVDSPVGRQVYQVEWTRVVAPEDVGVAAATDYPALTLVTCFPFRYVGNAPERFIVRARRLEGEPTPTLEFPEPSITG